MRDCQFIAEAILLAETAGFYPALGQRAVDWESVAAWAEAVRRPEFVWLAEQQLSGCGFIIVASNRAIASGQHRILAGLVAGKPVPAASISRLTCPLPVQPWR
ncbi:MAG TPA: hypothetical protein VKT77_13265 [Chthonomonadaceae bacterium]|nr:hypothetical protein [Chthonomonadaceae bacterium]